jgi:hypothetical protein
VLATIHCGFIFPWNVVCLTQREEHILRVSENRVLRRIFGSKREEAAVGWRKFYNKELHNLYSLPVKLRVVELRGITLKLSVHMCVTYAHPL